MRPTAAVVALALAAGLVSGCALKATGSTPEGNRSGRPASVSVAGQQQPPVLQVGDCLTDMIVDTTAATEPVSCDRAHRDEVYHRVEFPAGDYPGDSVVEQTADQQCLDAFAAFVGVDYADSVYGYRTVWPSQSQWDGLNNRTALCLIGKYDGSDKTGTARGTEI